MGAWTITFMIGFTLAFNPLTPRFLILFPNQPYMLNIQQFSLYTKKLPSKKFWDFLKNRKKVHFVPVIGLEPIIGWLLRPLRMPNSAIPAILRKE